MRIFLDTGHGPNSKTKGQYDPGADPDGAGPVPSEHDIAKRMVSIARGWVPKNKVIILPELQLNDLVACVNAEASRKDLLLSVHLNSGPPQAHGVEVVYHYAANQLRRNQAFDIGQAFADSLGIRFRRVLTDTETPAGIPRKGKKAGLPILRDTICPAFILEAGFITNEVDRHALLARGHYALTILINKILSGEISFA